VEEHDQKVGTGMKYLFAGVIAALSLLLVTRENDAGEKAKHTIAHVMGKAMKVGLHKKVASGKASDEEKKQLVELYEALTKNEPPQGDIKAWQKQTGTMLAAAKKAADGDEAAAKSLLKIINCGQCHKMFKG
jgi:hypothetical protein